MDTQQAAKRHWVQIAELAADPVFVGADYLLVRHSAELELAVAEVVVPAAAAVGKGVVGTNMVAVPVPWQRHIGVAVLAVEVAIEVEIDSACYLCFVQEQLVAPERQWRTVHFVAVLCCMDKQTRTRHNCIRKKREDMPDSLELLLLLQELLWPAEHMDCMVQHDHGTGPEEGGTTHEGLLHMDWVLAVRKLVQRHRNDCHNHDDWLEDTDPFLENEIVISTSTVDILSLCPLLFLCPCNLCHILEIRVDRGHIVQSHKIHGCSYHENDQNVQNEILYPVLEDLRRHTIIHIDRVILHFQRNKRREMNTNQLHSVELNNIDDRCTQCM